MTPAAAGYEAFEVEADVGVHAWGPTMSDAFAQAALGVLSLIVDPAEVAEVETREVRAQADSREALLVTWINECLYVHEIEGIVVRRVEVDRCGDGVVHGVLHGEEFDRARHHAGTIVKAATFHAVSVASTPSGWDVRVVVDI